MNYAFTHQDTGYTPAGITIPASEVQTHNEQLEQAQLAEMKTHPERVFLYVQVHSNATLRGDFAWARGRASITLWTGTVLDDNALIGPRRDFPCFGPFPSRRRAVECRIFGVRYVGWYFESSGDYCRLRKAKKQ